MILPYPPCLPPGYWVHCPTPVHSPTGSGIMNGSSHPQSTPAALTSSTGCQTTTSQDRLRCRGGVNSGCTPELEMDVRVLAYTWESLGPHQAYSDPTHVAVRSSLKTCGLIPCSTPLGGRSCYEGTDRNTGFERKQELGPEVTAVWSLGHSSFPHGEARILQDGCRTYIQIMKLDSDRLSWRA